MIDVKKIIADLETMKRVPNMFINPVTPEILACYLIGLQRGVFLSQNEMTFHDFVEAHKFAVHSRGLKNAAMHSYHELRKKGVSEDDIIQEMLEIEIEMWRTLEKWEMEK